MHYETVLWQIHSPGQKLQKHLLWFYESYESPSRFYVQKLSQSCCGSKEEFVLILLFLRQIRIRESPPNICCFVDVCSTSRSANFFKVKKTWLNFLNATQMFQDGALTIILDPTVHAAEHCISFHMQKFACELLI